MGQATGGARSALAAVVLAAVVLAAVVVATAGCSGKAAGPDEPELGGGTVPPTQPQRTEGTEGVEITEGVEEVGPEVSAAVFVNGVGLDDGTLGALESELGWTVADGTYWYDPVLGAVGYEGGPTAGFLPAGLAIGGPLPEDASAGTTGVFLNGRELPVDDLTVLEQFFGTIAPDYYFLDAEGYYGYEGDVPLGNVFDVVAANQQSGGGGFVEETAGGWIGGSGDDSYYFDPESGCSVMAGDGVSC